MNATKEASVEKAGSDTSPWNVIPVPALKTRWSAAVGPTTSLNGPNLSKGTSMRWARAAKSPITAVSMV